MDSNDGWFGPKPQYTQNDTKNTFFSSIRPFRIEDAQSNCSNPFISAPSSEAEGGILNENWCKFPTAKDLWFTTEGLETMPEKQTQLSRSNISETILQTFPFTKEQLQAWAYSIQTANTLPTTVTTMNSPITNIFDPKMVAFIKANPKDFKQFLGSEKLGAKKITNPQAQDALYNYYMEMDTYFTKQDDMLTTTTLNEKRKLANQDAGVTYKSQYLNLFNVVIGVLFVISLIYIFMRATIQPAVDAAKSNATGALSGVGSMVLGSIKGAASIPLKIFSGISGRIMSLFGRKPAPAAAAAPVAPAAAAV